MVGQRRSDFFGERVVQPYRNPTDRRIKKLIHEEGKLGQIYTIGGKLICVKMLAKIRKIIQIKYLKAYSRE